MARNHRRPPGPREAPPPLPPGPPPPMYTFTGGQGTAQAQFSFRVDQGPASQFPRQDGRTQAMPGGGVESSPRRMRDRPRYREPFVPSSRPLLSSRRARTPDQFSGMTEDRNGQGKFILAEDVSDSDEQDMDVDSPPGSPNVAATESAQDPQDDANEPPRKKRIAEQDVPSAIDEAAKPKWSNPDPYTVLPPPDESRRKKKDVVKLIRKARKAAIQAPTGDSTVATGENFIALTFEDDDVEADPDADLSDETRRVQAKAPSGPRASRPQDRVEAEGDDRRLPKDNANLPYQAVEVWPPPNVDEALGNRKRTHDDLIKDKPGKIVTRGAPKEADGSVLPEWKALKGGVIPWGGMDHSQTVNMGFWLHKEICDFFSYVRPRKFEQAVREDLIRRVGAVIASLYPDCEVRCFGSFASGLYLPTADMDLVCLSRGFLATGQPKPVFSGKQSYMFTLAAFLKSSGIARKGSVQVIPKAKVPIIKFVDVETGIQVDLCFENSTGIVAVDTCMAWKAQFPAMPILVLILKHFLTMRGLHEVRNGGLGGFAVTCMVTSLLQNMPQVQSGNMVPEHHLGEMLMEFFHLYAHRFNLEGAAIRLNPAGYFEKRLAMQFKNHLKSTKMTIEDPNRPDNDITGGTTGIRLIVYCFGRAYEALHQKMWGLRQAEFAERQGQNILWTILGGDYSSFDQQRERMRQVYERRFGIDLEQLPDAPDAGQRQVGDIDPSNRSSLTFVRSIGEGQLPLQPLRTADQLPRPSKKIKLDGQEASNAMNASSNTADDEDDPIIKASKRTETRAEKKPKLEKKRADRLRAKHPHLKDVPERLSAAQQKRFLFQHGLLPKVEQEKMTKMVKAEERRERKHARNAPRRMAKGKAPMGPGSAAAAAAAVAAVAAAVGKPSKRARRQRSRSANLTGPGPAASAVVSAAV